MDWLITDEDVAELKALLDDYWRRNPPLETISELLTADARHTVGAGAPSDTAPTGGE